MLETQAQNLLSALPPINSLAGFFLYLLLTALASLCCLRATDFLTSDIDIEGAMQATIKQQRARREAREKKARELRQAVGSREAAGGEQREMGEEDSGHKAE